MTKEFNASEENRHSSSSGFINYISATGEQIRHKLNAVFATHPDAVVIDGDDNWYADDKDRPPVFLNVFNLQPLATFHTGISGITKSGVVVDQESYQALKDLYAEKYDVEIDKNPRLRFYTRESLES